MEHSCDAMVYEGMARYHCSREGTNDLNGKWYCWQHDPQQVEERRQRRMDKQDMKAKYRLIERMGQKMYDVIKDIVRSGVNVGITPEQWQQLYDIVQKIEKED